MNKLKIAMLISAGLSVSATSSLLAMNANAEMNKYKDATAAESIKNETDVKVKQEEGAEKPPYHLTKHEMKTSHTAGEEMDHKTDHKMSNEAGQNKSYEMSRETNSKNLDQLAMNVSDTVIKFELDSSELTPKAEKSLSGLIDTLRESKIPEAEDQIDIVIIGHTDKTGEEKHNQVLSKQRAKAVETFLKSEGVSNVEFETEAMGESDPVAPNDTKNGRAENRRVEILIHDDDISKDLSSISQ